MLDPVPTKKAIESRKPPSKAAIQRAVASSTALETGKPVSVIEEQLRSGRSKFRHLKLAD